MHHDNVDNALFDLTPINIIIMTNKTFFNCFIFGENQEEEKKENIAGYILCKSIPYKAHPDSE